jgi:hypothetical protein
MTWTSWGSFPGREKEFPVHKKSRLAMQPTGPPVYRLLEAPSLGVKWPGHEVDHSHPPTANVKNEWRYTSTHTTCLHGVDSDNFNSICTTSNR